MLYVESILQHKLETRFYDCGDRHHFMMRTRHYFFITLFFSAEFDKRIKKDDTSTLFASHKRCVRTAPITFGLQ